MAEVTTSHENYWVAPEEDREGNHKYISHDTSDSHGTDMKVPVESAVIIDVGVNINTDPLHMFPENNSDPTLQWGSCNGNRWLYFIPPESEQIYYKGSNFAVLAIPSYAYDTSTKFYKCSGYMTDVNSYSMTTVRTLNESIGAGTLNPITGQWSTTCSYDTIDDFAKDKVIDSNPDLKRVEACFNGTKWDLTHTNPPGKPDIPDHSNLTDPEPPVTIQYYGLKTQNLRQVFSGIIYNQEPATAYTTCAYECNFNIGDTLYWDPITECWSTT